MLLIDGSTGEGGGQVLRSSLSLSLCLGRPFSITNIRKARTKPGLRPQHLAAVRAAAAIGNAKVEGASIGSHQLTFVPAGIVPGCHHFDIGTAGSTTLLAQTVLPPLLTAPAPSRLLLEGGTHNPNAPPFEFLELALFPLLNRMGPKVQGVLQRYGFYPKGGGRLCIDVEPIERLRGFVLVERGAAVKTYAVAIVGNLPDHIAERELAVIQEKLALPQNALIMKRLTDVSGAGNVVMVVVESAFVTEVLTGFGQRGVRAERIATRLANQAHQYIQAGVPVGAHLADQLLVPLALAGNGSFVTARPTRHTITNIEIIKQFVAVEIVQRELQRGVWRIEVS